MFFHKELIITLYLPLFFLKIGILFPLISISFTIFCIGVCQFSFNIIQMVISVLNSSDLTFIMSINFCHMFLFLSILVNYSFLVCQFILVNFDLMFPICIFTLEFFIITIHIIPIILECIVIHFNKFLCVYLVVIGFTF